MNKKNGEGQLTVEGDQYIYDGHWQNDLRQGIGIEICKKLGKYTGTWLQDKRHGEGVGVNLNGDIYTG